jgi:Recombination endonuclease VII
MKVCTRCGKNRNERFYSGPKGRICKACQKIGRSAATHESRVQRTYGLEPGEYARLLESQSGACAICLETRSGRLAVDHRHSDGLVRGLLCARCNNQLLGRGARDRPDVLRRAADYLEWPPAVEIIGIRKAPSGETD